MNITQEESDAIVALLQPVSRWGEQEYNTTFSVTVGVTGTVVSWLLHAHHKEFATGATLQEAMNSLRAKCQPEALHETKMAELKELERRAEELRKELAQIPKL